jgi:hypothetical protein
MEDKTRSTHEAAALVEAEVVKGVLGRVERRRALGPLALVLARDMQDAMTHARAIESAMIERLRTEP